MDELSGEYVPGLQLDVWILGNPQRKTYLRAHLDSGADLSVFDGALLVQVLGLDLMAGREQRLESAQAYALTARIHRLELSHPDLGRFILDAAISTVPIRRNLLGRDFFRHIQIGFREFHHTFHLTAAA